MNDVHLHYEPLIVDPHGALDERVFLYYVERSSWPRALKSGVISPLENALKNSWQQEPFDFDNFTVKVIQNEPKKYKWKKVYIRLTHFLEIRSDDSQASKIPGLKYKEGIGYCIAIDDLLSKISSDMKKSRAKSKLVVRWPRKKHSDPPIRDIIIPDLDYSKIMKETAYNVLRAKRFRTSFIEEVVRAYKTINENWLREETGYDRKNIPPKKESPLRRRRHIGNLRYVFINLVREDKPDYMAIIQTLVSDLREIRQGQRGPMWEIYRPADDGFINIKRVRQRLDELLNSPQYIKSDVRYEIAP